MSALRLLLNLIWLFLAGFWLAVGYVIAGLICCILIVTIPFGVASFRIAAYVIWPFGREIVAKPGSGAGAALLNVIWFIVAGWWLAIGHVVTAFFLAITIVGLPLALANLKLIPVSLVPFGKDIVRSDELAGRTASYSVAPRRV